MALHISLFESVSKQKACVLVDCFTACVHVCILHCYCVDTRCLSYPGYKMAATRCVKCPSPIGTTVVLAPPLWHHCVVGPSPLAPLWCWLPLLAPLWCWPLPFGTIVVLAPPLWHHCGVGPSPLAPLWCWLPPLAPLWCWPLPFGTTVVLAPPPLAPLWCWLLPFGTTVVLAPPLWPHCGVGPSPLAPLWCWPLPFGIIVMLAPPLWPPLWHRPLPFGTTVKVTYIIGVKTTSIVYSMVCVVGTDLSMYCRDCICIHDGVYMYVFYVLYVWMCLWGIYMCVDLYVSMCTLYVHVCVCGYVWL